MQYTQEQQAAMDKRAEDAAREEFKNDPNRKDPKHNHDRAVAAVHELRVKWGLEER